MYVSKRVNAWSGSCEHRYWTNTSSYVWCVIKQVCCMGESHGPQIFFRISRPTECSVNHHGTRVSDNNFNCIFGSSILELCTNSTQCYSLSFLCEFAHKFLGSKHTIVGVIRLDINPAGERFTLKFGFRLNGFGGGGANLMRHEDIVGGGINEQRSTIVCL